MTDWAITVPKTIKWPDYEKELEAAAGGLILNYRLAHSTGVLRGDRVFTIYDGKVRGWMLALGVTHHPHGFRCSTAGRFWAPGYYLQRTGKFNAVDGPPVKGFRGIRTMVSVLRSLEEPVK